LTVTTWEGRYEYEVLSPPSATEFANCCCPSPEEKDNGFSLRHASPESAAPPCPRRERTLSATASLRRLLAPFPNLIWLVALSSPQLTLRNVVSNRELFEMVQTSTMAWKQGLSHIAEDKRLALLLDDMQSHFDVMLRDAVQQTNNASDMDDKPAPAGGRPHPGRPR
jgi:hypothetical protein